MGLVCGGGREGGVGGGGGVCFFVIVKKGRVLDLPFLKKKKSQTDYVKKN